MPVPGLERAMSLLEQVNEAINGYIKELKSFMIAFRNFKEADTEAQSSLISLLDTAFVRDKELNDLFKSSTNMFSSSYSVD